MEKKKRTLTKTVESLFTKKKLKDIVEHDTKSFVWIDENSKKIDWPGFTDGENFCSFQLKGAVVNNAEDALRKALSLCRAMRPVLGIPRTIDLVTTNDRSYTDGKVIAVNAGFFNAPELSYLTKIDLLLGEFLHEGYHILYTDFVLRTNKISCFSGLKNLYAFLNNIIEDERIERKGSSDFPGYTGYIAKIKKYLIRENFLKKLKADLEEHTDHAEERNVIARLSSVFFALVRYPANLLEEDAVMYANFIKDVQQLFSEGYPETNIEAWDKTDAVYDLFKKYALAELEELEKKRKDVEELAEAEKEMLEALFSKIAEELGELLHQVLSDGSDKVTGLEGVMVISGPSGLGYDPSTVRKMIDVVYKEMDEVYAEGTTSKTKFFRADDNRYAYQKSKEEIGTRYKVLRTLMQREHRDHKLVLKGTKTGKLDKNKLVQAVLGSENIYENYASLKSKRVDLVVLIDQSGSMHSRFRGDKTRIEAARDTGVMLKETFKKSKDTQVFMYGFTSDEEGEGGTNSIRIYQEPGFNRPFTLGSLEALANNRDGECIYEVAVRVRKLTKNPCLFVVVSDGAPSAYNYSGYEHTRQMVEKVEKMQFAVMQIAIGAVASEKMFKHFVSFTNVADLPKAIGDVVKKLLRKLVKAEITY